MDFINKMKMYCKSVAEELDYNQRRLSQWDFQLYKEKQKQKNRWYSTLEALEWKDKLPRIAAGVCSGQNLLLKRSS